MAKAQQEHWLCTMAREIKQGGAPGAPSAPQGHLFLQHQVPTRVLLHSGLQGGAAPATSCACLQPQPLHAQPSRLHRGFAGVGSGASCTCLRGQCWPHRTPQRGVMGASGGGCAARVPPHVPATPQTRCFLKAEQRLGLLEGGTTRAEPTEARAHHESVSSCHSSTPIPVPFSLLLPHIP